jgi:hypothetical protein
MHTVLRKASARSRCRTERQRLIVPAAYDQMIGLELDQLSADG